MANPIVENTYDSIFQSMGFYRDKRNPTRILAEYKRPDGYWELQDVNDVRFQAYVNNLLRQLTNQDDDIFAYNRKLSKYTDEAILSGEKVSVKTRLDGTRDETAYFIGGDNNIIALINKDGYKLFKSHKNYKFLKPDNLLEQVRPKPDKAKNLLKRLTPFLNMSKDMQLLFAVNLVQQFITTSSHFLSVINSPKGTGKTTFMRMWRNIIDPRLSEISILPSTAEELKNHLANNLVVCFDNTKPLSKDFSDILCGAVTGTTYSKRKLYTDNTEVTYELHNTVILNGINIIPQESDLLDRSMLFKLDKLNHKDRIDESEIKENLDKAIPYILGSIFDTLTEYFKIKDSITVEGAHRMSSAYKDCYIIATILGMADEFVAAFDRNQYELQKGFSESNPLISTIFHYFELSGKSSIDGTATEVYTILRRCTDDPYFPKSASAFSRQLKQEQDTLSGAGLEFIRDNSQRNYTRIRIVKKR